MADLKTPGEAEAAYEMAMWAERFEEETPDDPAFAHAIAEIKAQADQER